MLFQEASTKDHIDEDLRRKLEEERIRLCNKMDKDMEEWEFNDDIDWKEVNEVPA